MRGVTWRGVASYRMRGTHDGNKDSQFPRIRISIWGEAGAYVIRERARSVEWRSKRLPNSSTKLVPRGRFANFLAEANPTRIYNKLADVKRATTTNGV